METAYEQAPLLGGTGAPAPAPLDPETLAPSHYGTLPLALLQHPSLQLTTLAFALLLALQTTAPVAALAALAASLLSAFLALTTHAASARPTSGPRARDRPPQHHPRHLAHIGHGPSALASLALDSAALIAVASWLACWAWADPPGPGFWLRWMPTLVLALFSFQLILAALVGYPPARPLLVDKAPPLLLTMDLPPRPVAGSPAFPPWLKTLAREVTLAWGVMAGLAAASCAIPAAMDRHAYAGAGGEGGGGGGEGRQGGGGGGGPMTVDGLDVALSVCVPFALGLAALALGDALCERARRAQLPRMMAFASRAQGQGGQQPSSSSGLAPTLQQQEAAAPPSGVAGLV
jgi:hypothetical protein